MSFLIAVLLALPVQADSQCLPSSAIVGDLSELQDTGSVLDALLASSSGSERALGESLEVLLVAAESGEYDILPQLSTNVFARISRAGLSAEQYEMAREIVDAFGPQRCVWGSNFPTAQYNPTLDYAETVRLFSEAIELTGEERAWILGHTAERLWFSPRA